MQLAIFIVGWKIKKLRGNAVRSLRAFDCFEFELKDLDLIKELHMMDEVHELWLVSDPKTVPKLLLNVFLHCLLDCIYHVYLHISS